MSRWITYNVYLALLLFINYLQVERWSLGRVRFSAAPETVAGQASLSLEFSRKDYWSGLPFPSPGDLPDPGMERVSSALAGGFFNTETPG